MHSLFINRTKQPISRPILTGEHYNQEAKSETARVRAFLGGE